MDPITIAAITAAIYLIIAGLRLIHTAFLVVSTIIDWFRTQARNREIRATLKERLANGQHKIIAVGLDSDYNVKESIAYKSDDIDSELRKAHHGKKLVIWT
ncbi:MAG: hypothetical protein F6K25_14865 [Okeania sp. SIO2G4]|uniref:hypothetical protein n=1 Tax=unclassified Okeania TaxID=2634635 RepID=UPI0013B6F75F|nr:MULTISPECIES: hypothetical protein [unclassified Okeania]NEP03718.1 hypothetical protein [Okeania sp. SIO4D6]NEP39303.1 hypothetical protein [Okeania sp. SIO2H7]NEP73207.1 hypothetical protein [Okeania sp. SIO2G5]NEP94071.1 hypothetical protein [Okeania sp. SIO2F5]NEQ91902.1 hypothetical protein [Okeania sp. SIO2G4]